MYTFTPIDSTAGLAYDLNDRVRLWIDSQLIIDQWVSLASLAPSATTSIPVANDYYELSMLYKVSSWGGPTFLGVTSQSLPSCTTSGNTFRLGPTASNIAGIYVNMYVIFTSGVCSGKWSKILSYSEQASDASFTATGSTTITPTTIDLGATAVMEDNYYLGATLTIACASAGGGTLQTVTVTAYTGATHIATTTTIAASCSTGLPYAGNSSYKVSGYQNTRCVTVSSTTWSDGVTSSCMPTTGDAYSLFYGTKANLQIKGGLILTSRSVASNELFISSQIQGSPFPVNVSCALTDFISSAITGGGLTIATVTRKICFE